MAPFRPISVAPDSDTDRGKVERIKLTGPGDNTEETEWVAMSAGGGGGGSNVALLDVVTADTTVDGAVDGTAETTVFTYSVPAGTVVAGDVLRLVLWGTVLNNSAANAAWLFRVKIGGTNYIVDSGASLATNTLRHAWRTEVEIVIRDPTGDAYCVYHNLISNAIAVGTATSIGRQALGHSVQVTKDWDSGAQAVALTVALNQTVNTDLVLQGGTLVHTAANSSAGVEVAIGVALSDPTSDVATGTNIETIRMPFGMNLTEVRSSVDVASSSGLVTVDINDGGVSVLSTELSIDATEETSLTATTPAVISDPVLADDAPVSFDITAAGTGAKRLKVWLIGTRT